MNKVNDWIWNFVLDLANSKIVFIEWICSPYNIVMSKKNNETLGYQRDNIKLQLYFTYYV